MFKKLRFTFLTIITFGLLFFIGSLSVKGFDLDIHTLNIESFEVTTDGQFNKLEDAALVDQFESFYGDTNMLLTDDSAEYEFSYYEEKGIFLSANPEYQFRVTEDHQFTAYFRVSGMAHVVILDSNNKVLGHKILAKGSMLSETDLESFKNDLSIKPGYTFSKWSYDFTQVVNQGVTFIKAIYNAKETLFDVTVDIGTTNVEQVLYGKTITVEAPDTKDELFFSHWTINGTIASYKRILTFSVYEDCTVKAIYSDSQPDINTFSYLSKNVINFENKKIFIAQSYSNQKILERGMIFLESDVEVTDIDFGTVGVTRLRALRVTNNGEFAITNTYDKTKYLYVKSYIVLEIGESEYQTIFSDILKVEKYNYATDLFFSEYIEGSGNNKALEIFNGTGNDVDLSTYAIYLYSNGAPNPTNKQTLSGILHHGETFVLCNSSSILELKNLSNITSSTANFNGNDALELLNNGIVIDSIGQVGFDPGTKWGDKQVSTVDMTLVRKSNIFSGRTNSTEEFDPNIEWEAHPIDTFTYLGSHEMDNMAPIMGLDEYKQNAKTQLDNYVSFDNYSVAVAQAVLNEINNGKILIDSATTFSEINNALDSAKQNIDLLPTKLDEYNEAKSNLVLPTGDIYSDINLGASPKEYIEYSWRFDPEGIFNPSTGTFNEPSVDTVVNIEVDILIDGVKFAETLTTTVTAKAPLNNDDLYNEGILYINREVGNINGSTIDNDLNLPTSHPDFANLTFIWESSNQKIIASDGTYTAPEADTEVILTVSILIDGIVSGADLTFNVNAKAAPSSIEKIYQTGFESSEGFTPSTTYNNSTPVLRGPSGKQWSFYYGTPSTTGAITGDQSAQMRWYSSAPNNFGYVEMDFTLNDIVKIEFKALAQSGYKVKLRYSVDGGDYNDGKTFDLTTSSEDYSYEINAMGAVKLRFELVSGGATKKGVIIDDVKIYYNETP